MMKLANYTDWHRPDDCIVTVPGPTFMGDRQAWQMNFLPDYWTIACNRATLKHRPDYFVCFEPADDSIWREVDLRGVSACFTHRPTGSMRGARKRPCPPRSVNVDSKDVRSFLAPGEVLAAPADVLRLNQSPFYGIAVAAHLGFRNIGVAGLELTPDRFGASMDMIEHAYTRLRGIIERRGQRVWNLTPQSHLESFQRAHVMGVIRPRDEVGHLTA